MEKYNIWYAVLHEFIVELINKYPNLNGNLWLRKILAWTRPDWVNWRTEQVMLDVSQQAEKLVEMWKTQEPPDHVLIEHEPDGSKAQELLGGAMEIKSRLIK